MDHPSRRARSGERGQAAVELAALLPLLAVFVALLWQAIVAGQAFWLAGSSARAAARAAAVGTDLRAAARGVLPPRLERGLAVVRVRGDGGGDRGVRVSIAVPSVVGGMRLGTVSARARLQEQRR